MGQYAGLSPGPTVDSLHARSISIFHKVYGGGSPTTRRGVADGILLEEGLGTRYDASTMSAFRTVVSRRSVTLGLAAFTTSAFVPESATAQASPQADAAASATGASTVGSELRVLDGGPEGGLRAYLDAVARKQFAARKQTMAAVRTPDDVRARQKLVRETVLRGFDGWPEKTPLNPQVVDTLQKDGYKIEKVLYQSLPGIHVTANLYIPTDPAHGSGPFPAVLGTSGHADDAKAYVNYQKGWINLVKRGFVVVAYDPIGQGERLQFVDEETGKSLVGNGVNEHIMLGVVAMMTGTNFARYHVWDGIRTVDYLNTRPEVDPKRIAVVGNSGGGTQSAYLNLLEPRLATAAPSCYITSWPTLWDGSGPQDAEQVFVDFVKDGFDFGDFLTAWAPRPVQMQTATQDFFPIAGARDTYQEAKRLYQIMGAPDAVGFYEYDDGHGWSQPRREATYRWFSQWLQGKENKSPELEVKTETEQTLYATRTGQVLTSLGGRSLQQVLRDRASDVYAKRKALDIPDNDLASFRNLLRTTLRMLPREKAGKPTQVGSAIQRSGYRVEKWVIPVGEQGRIPALLLVPTKSRADSKVVVYLDDRGKAAHAQPGGRLEALAKAGHAVLAVDLRGTGEWQSADKEVGHTRMYQDAMRAVLVGTSLVAIQTGDLLDVLAAAPLSADWAKRPVRIVGKGNMGWIGLLAAALTEGSTAKRVEGVAAEEAPLSYSDVARSPRHHFVSGLTVPGVLQAFDMPDVVATLADKQVLLLNARSGMGHIHARETVRHEYAPAANAFLAAGREDALQIRRENEGMGDAALQEWMSR